MTYMKHLLINFEYFTVPKYVQVANGVKIHTIGKGTVILNSQLKLLNVLYTPELSFNLISVRKLTLDNNCIATFSSSEVIFQETSMRERIGNAKSYNDLYFFGAKESDRKLCCAAESNEDDGLRKTNRNCILL